MPYNRGFAAACRNVTAVNLTNGLHSSITEQGDLHCGTNISSTGTSAVARSSSLLSNINLSGCWEITDIGISFMAYSCPILRNINLTACRKITNNGVSALARCCPLLNSINFSKCLKITDIV